jgi:small nuclear ribonucleoprotein (snRNP)-like protein
MADSQVVLRYRDGRTERATLAAVDPDRQVFAVERDGERDEVPFGEMKAVFFPRTTPEELLEPASGSTIAVEFADGEVIRGVAHYNPERNGFFLYPSDRSKNERIFVVRSAIVSIEVEKL